MEQKISVSQVSARAKTVSGGSGIQLSGNVHVTDLEINGTPVVYSGKPNQIVWLPLGTGKVVINEQIQTNEGSSESLTVNALHVTIPGTIELVISSDRAEVSP